MTNNHFLPITADPTVGFLRNSRTMNSTIRSTVLSLTASLALAGMLAAQEPAKPAAAMSGPQVFAIDDVHSMALFRVHHLGAGQFWGRFNEVSGNFTFEQGKAEGLKFDVTIKTESVDSGNADLDKHLRSPDFFSTKDFPAMTFKSTKATKTGESTYDVMGELTMHGVTKPVTAKVEFCGMRDMGRGPKAGFEATFTVKRSEFGVNYGVEKGAIGDDVKVIVGLEGSPAK
jgi:polyisoprenoid-binding protein YceI